MARTRPSNHDFNELRYAARTEETLSETAKVYRDAFCREYIKDFNATQAVIRLGAPDKQSATTKGSILLAEGYVANQIYQLVRQLRPDDVVSRQQVMARMWLEANSDSNEGATRVKALAHLAKMLGMMEEKKETSTVSSGVMLVPLVDVAEWQQSATIAQDLLKREVAAVPTFPPCPPPPQPTHGTS